jgi:Tfp pilus assembly protein PilF
MKKRANFLLATAAVAALLAAAMAMAPPAPSAAGAAPFTPAFEAEVLERLPAGTAARRREREALRAAPGDLGRAVRLARRYIDAARAESDPRWLGRAEAALAPWWRAADAPAQVLVLRATIRQSRHEFDAALADLAAALQVAPDDAQAWLTRAVILQVRGDYPEALRSCAPLGRLSSEIAHAACLAQVRGVTGEARPAYAALDRALTRALRPTPAERAWALGLLAELGERLGEAALAERHYREALGLGRDPYLLGAYADFLLDTGRPGDAAALLEGETADALLLRLAIAQRALGAPSAEGHVAALRERFAASRRRGDAAHRREEARFELEIEGRPQRALELAREGFREQREPADARLLLAASLAAGDPEAARPALSWLTRTGHQDPRIRALADRLRRAK